MPATLSIDRSSDAIERCHPHRGPLHAVTALDTAASAGRRQRRCRRRRSSRPRGSRRVMRALAAIILDS
eukprot:3922391-Pleurochrysis_carterae.AAC.1